MTPTEMFLAHAVGGRARVQDPSQLEALVDGLVTTGRAAWPDVKIATSDFLRHLAERLPDDADIAEALKQTDAADLFLACGCTLGEPHALAAFDEQYITRVSSQLVGNRRSAAAIDEIKQRLRMRLLIPGPEGAPRIATYHGRRSLAAWLSVIAGRIIVDIKLDERHGPEELADLIAADDVGAELQYMKVRYGAEVQSALKMAIAALPSRERAVLRLHFLGEMPSEALASTYAVSRRTIHRWLTDARDSVLVETKRNLRERLCLSPSELDSIVQLVQSQIAKNLSSDEGED